MSFTNTFITVTDVMEYARSEQLLLPAVQRGFVWRPYQIENFWDSLLRGYPVGAFVTAKKSASEKQMFELLDGQQRATSICLGFYNPLGTGQNSNVFKASSEYIRIFIDLEKLQNDNRKYIFRVITKAHPWGYQRRENQKTLEAQKIAEAQKNYGLADNENYLDVPLDRFWPFEAGNALPWGLFLASRDFKELENQIAQWRSKNNVKEISDARDQPLHIHTLREIFDSVQLMLARPCIPVLELPEALLRPTAENIGAGDGTDNSREDEDNANGNTPPNVEDREVDAVENLFVRLNSAGTPLRGEELNYSLLKTRIAPCVQQTMEEACAGLFSPARFLTLAVRLFQHKKSKKSEERQDKPSLNLQIKPAQFSKILNNECELLTAYLEKLTEGGKQGDKIRKLHEVLVYSDKNQYGLPPFVAVRLADSAPEIMFMLLYRLWEKKDAIAINSETHRKMLGMVTLFAWLGQYKNRKNYAPLLRNIAERLYHLPADKFWSADTVSEAALLCNRQQTLRRPPRLKYNNLRTLRPGDDITKITQMNFDNYVDKPSEDGEYADFISSMFTNRELVLYAQREALHTWFPNPAVFLLEDTNRPFDYDHISPQSLIYNKTVRDELKDWYYTIGNIRAWPYAWNRQDGDDTAAKKLTIKKNQFRKNCAKLRINCTYYENVYYDWSICDYDVWNEITFNNNKLRAKDDIHNQNAKTVISAIWNRNVDLCEKWYSDLLINDLIPRKWPVKTIEDDE